MVLSFILGQLLSGFTLSGIIWGLSRFAVPRPSVYDMQEKAGTIAPSQTLAFVITALSFAASLFFIHDYLLGGLLTRGLYDPSWTLSAVIGGCLLLFTAVCATCFTTAYDVSWTQSDVTGPVSYKVPPFGPQKATIPFKEIINVGMDGLGSWYVKNSDGLRIRWGWTHAGYRELMRVIERERPDLFSNAETDFN